MFFLVAIVRYIVVACPGTEKQLKKTEEIKCVLFFIMTTEKCKMFPRTLITLFLVAIVRYTASICLRTQKQKQIKKKGKVDDHTLRKKLFQKKCLARSCIECFPITELLSDKISSG